MAGSHYLQWQSELSLEKVFSKTPSFSYPTPYANCVLYLTAIASEKQRQALVLRTADGERHFLTPAPFHLNSKINEYGGKPYWVHESEIVFANRADQCLYRQVIDETRATTPQAITLDGLEGLCMYAEVNRLDKDFYIAIVEQEVSGGENACYLASINCLNGAAKPEPVVQGADFYNNLVVDVARNKIAWVEWNHPAMPWDDNQCWVADYKIVNQHIQLLNKQRIKLDSEASFCQLCFASNGDLFFCADRRGFTSNQTQNYWNIYRASFTKTAVRTQQVTELKMEFGYPHWQFGDARLVVFDDQHLIAHATSQEGERLYRIDQDTLEYSVFEKTDGRYQMLSGNGQSAVTLLEQSTDQAIKLVCLDGANKQNVVTGERYLSSDDISVAQHIEYPTHSKVEGASYGYYYAPKNGRYQNQGPPPLLVMVHGGPTGRAYPNYDLQKQFWTNRGFAVFDVNHRGSTGYGRCYRDALLGHWGELDTSDIVDGIKHLVGQQLAHPEQICIRGKSAGGYAVLRALTEYPDTFRAGACYYGIGNLATLAEVTHKFEKHYTDRLINEPYDKTRAHSTDSAYHLRSPINNIANIRSSMIIFQGSQDNVVPPSVAHEMVKALEHSGISHRYIEYADEGHGFRQTENNIDAWTNELAFYREVLANG